MGNVRFPLTLAIDCLIAASARMACVGLDAQEVREGIQLPRCVLQSAECRLLQLQTRPFGCALTTSSRMVDAPFLFGGAGYHDGFAASRAPSLASGFFAGSPNRRDQQKWNRRLGANIVAHAAEENFTDEPSPLASHDDEGGVCGRDVPDDLALVGPMLDDCTDIWNAAGAAFRFDPRQSSSINLIELFDLFARVF